MSQNIKQHFSMRKLTTGLASVMLATSFLIATPRVAHASNMNNDTDNENHENLPENDVNDFKTTDDISVSVQYAENGKVITTENLSGTQDKLKQDIKSKVPNGYKLVSSLPKLEDNKTITINVEKIVSSQKAENNTKKTTHLSNDTSALIKQGEDAKRENAKIEKSDINDSKKQKSDKSSINNKKEETNKPVDTKKANQTNNAKEVSKKAVKKVRINNPFARYHQSFVATGNWNAKVELVDSQTGKTVRTFSSNDIEPNENVSFGKIELPKNYKWHAGVSSPKNMSYDEFSKATNGSFVLKLQIDSTVKTEKEEKTVTRKIVLHEPNGTQTITQTIKPYREKYTDLQTGKVTYGDWVTGVLEAKEIPEIDEYDAYIGNKISYEVPAMTVNGDTKDSTVDVYYKNTSSNQTVQYVDDVTGQIVGTDTLRGEAGSKITTEPNLPLGYSLSNNEKQVTVTISKDNTPVQIKVHAAKLKVTHDDPKKAGTTLPGITQATSSYDTYPTGVDQNDLNRVIHRIINVNDPNNSGASITQTVKFYRDASIDLSTMDVDYTPWQTDGDKFFPEYKVPAVQGYIASQDNVPAYTPSPDDQDQTVDVNYDYGSSQVNIIFVNDSKSGQTVATYHKSGDIGQNVDLSDIQIPDGYSLAQGQSMPKSYKMTDQFNNNVTIHLTEKTTDVSDTDAKANRTITRKIVFVKPDGSRSITTQTIKFHRSASYNEGDKQTTYGKWQVVEVNGKAVTPVTQDSYKFSSVDVPEISGYQVAINGNVNSSMITNKDGKPQVFEETVSPDSPDKNYTITYDANEQQGSWKFIDDDANGVIVDSGTFTGTTDSSQKLNLTIPDNYELNTAKTPALPTEATFKDADGKPIEIHLKHKTKDVSDSDSDVTKTIIRSISFTNPNDFSNHMHDQKVTFTRHAMMDLVTNNVAYSNWEGGGDWPEYTPPAVGDYTYDTIPKKTVTPTMENVVVNSDYHHGAVSLTINYVDRDTGKVVGTQKIPSDPDSIVKINAQLPDHYKLTDAGIPGTYYIGSNNDSMNVTVVNSDGQSDKDQFTTHVSFQTEDGNVVSTKDYKGDAGSTFDYSKDVPKGYKLQDGDKGTDTINLLADQDKVVTIVKVDSGNHDSNDKKDQFTTHVVFQTENGTTISTKDYKGDAGSTFNYGKDVPKGYKLQEGDKGTDTINLVSDQDKVVTIEKDTSNKPSDSNDKKDQFTTHVIFQTEDGTTISTKDYKGDAGSTFNYSKDVPKGYKLQEGDKGTDTINLVSDQDKVVTIEKDNTNKPNDGGNVKDKHTTHVSFQTEDGATIATKDYTGDAGSTFDYGKDVPKGYKLQEGDKGTDTINLLADQDKVVTIEKDTSGSHTGDNVKDKHTTHVNFVTEDGATIATKDYTGDAGSTFNYGKDVPKGYKLQEGDKGTDTINLLADQDKVVTIEKDNANKPNDSGNIKDKHTTHVNFVTEDGATIASKDYTGDAGSTFNYGKDVPKGYKLQEGDKGTDTINLLADQDKVVTIEKDTSGNHAGGDTKDKHITHVNFVTEDGVTVATKDYTGDAGSTFNYGKDVPKGYKLQEGDKGTDTINLLADQDKVVTIEKDTSGSHTGGDTKDKHTTHVSFVTEDGVTIASKDYTGDAGSSFNYGKDVPKGYKLQEGDKGTDTINLLADQDKVVTIVKTDSGNHNNNKAQHTITILFTNDGQVIRKMTYTGDEDSTIDYSKDIPNGYKLANKSDNGKVKITFADQTYAIDVISTKDPEKPADPQEKHRVVIRFVDDDFATISYKIYEGPVGQEIDYNKDIPKGYSLADKNDTGKTKIPYYDETLAISVKTPHHDTNPNETHKLTLEFVEGLRVVGTKTFTGKYGDVIDYKSDIPKGYQLLDPSQGTTEKISFVDQKVPVIVVEKTNDTSSVKHNLTIHFVDENGKDVSTVIFTGDENSDIDYSSNVPEGYNLVDSAHNAKISNKDSEINVKIAKKTTPAKDEHTVTINFVDKDGKTISTKSYTGKKGDSIDYTKDIPTGYSNDDSQKVTVGDKDSSVNVKIKKSTSAPSNEKTHTLTVDFVDQNGNSIITKTYKGKLGENVVYADDIPSGYIITDNNPGSFVFSDKDDSLKVQIGSASENIHFTFIDNETMKKVGEHTFNGKSGSEVNINSYLPKGYEYVDDNQPTKFVIGKDTGGEILVKKIDNNTNKSHTVTIKFEFTDADGKTQVIDTKTVSGVNGTQIPDMQEEVDSILKQHPDWKFNGTTSSSATLTQGGTITDQDGNITYHFGPNDSTKPDNNEESNSNTDENSDESTNNENESNSETDNDTGNEDENKDNDTSDTNDSEPVEEKDKSKKHQNTPEHKDTTPDEKGSNNGSIEPEKVSTRSNHDNDNSSEPDDSYDNTSSTDSNEPSHNTSSSNNNAERPSRGRLPQTGENKSDEEMALMGLGLLALGLVAIDRKRKKD